MKKLFTQIVCLGFGFLLMGVSNDASAQFAMGADVSWLQQGEAMGHKWYDINGKQVDVLAFLKSKGVNSIRLRTWINPNMNDPFSGHCSQKETIAMAVRCKNLGLRVMVDFHYNNTWTSVGSQGTPVEWQNLTYEQMKTALYNYAHGFCVAMKAAGVTPEWFQNGNETNKGICNPTGSLSKPTQMTGLLNSGYEAIKSVFPTTKVLIHTAQPQKTEGQNMIETYIKNGGKLDAIGLSTYASYSIQPGIQNSVKTNYYDKFGLEVIMVEIGSHGNQSDVGKLIANWATDNAKMNKPCKGGIFYWEPQAYDSPFRWTDVLFDANGRATVAVDGFMTKVPNCSVVTGIEDEPAVENGAGNLNFYPNPFTSSLTIEMGGDFEYTVYDMTGQSVEKGTGNDKHTVGQTLRAGMYLVNVKGNNGEKSIKVIKN